MSAKLSHDAKQKKTPRIQFSTKIILKLLARNRKSRKQRSFFQRILCKITWPSRIVAFSKKLFARFPRHMIYNHRISLLWCLFLLLWHPGIYSRTPLKVISRQKHSSIIPTRPKIYPVEKVRLRVNALKGWLTLYMEDKKIAGFPAIVHLPAGKYRVSSLLEIENEALACLQGEFCKATLQPRDIVTKGFFIALDKDYWEILSPYLRSGTPVFVYTALF